MGIYLKKNRKSGLKITIYSLFFILLSMIISYYFFFSKNGIDISYINGNNQNLESIENSKNFEEKMIPNLTLSDLEGYVREDQLNNAFSEIFNQKDFEAIIKNYIKNNPQFILEVLRNYQEEQSTIEKEKINEKNLSNIYKIYTDEHPMFIGSKNTNKRIFEFVDYNCGYCLKFHEEIIKVMNGDPNLQLVIIQMPILGKMSEELSKIAIASSLQGKFEEVHNYFYSPNRKSKIENILADLFLMNVDLSKLESDLNNDQIDLISISHKNYVDDFKFTGSPSIIIGNTIIPGFIEANQIIEILKKEFP